MNIYINLLISHKIQKLPLAKISLQMIVDLHGSYASRCSGINQIAYFQRKEATYIRDNLIYRKQHIRGIAFLYLRAIDIQMERKPVYIPRLLQRNKGPDHSRIIKRLTNFPR